MPSTRRPTIQSPANPPSSLPLRSRSANELVMHEPGSQEVSTYTSSSGRGPPARLPSVIPAPPTAPRPARTSSLTAPPALPADAAVAAPMTVASLKAWAAAPGQSRAERKERASVVKKLTNKSFLRARTLKNADCLGLPCMTHLTSLPSGLPVLGFLDLNGCTALTELPDGLLVSGGMSLSGCTALTRLPKGLPTQGGFVDLSDCTALTELPDGLSAPCGLVLSGCTALTRLPERLSVDGGYFSLRGCTALTQLSEGLSPVGRLDLRDCTALTHLPEGLSVGGSLLLSGCTSLTRLPARLSVEGDMDVSGCTSLTQLPANVLQWRLPNNGRFHIIDLSRSGIRQEMVQAMENIAGEGVQLVYNVHEERPLSGGRFANLTAAMAFWRPLALTNTHTDFDGDTAPDLHADPQQLNSFLAFLERLIGTADYQNINSRPLLAQRVVGLTNQLATSESLAALCHERIGQALESCGDRVVWAMNQLELTVRVHQAQQGSAPEQELRDLGRSLLRLQVVHQHATAKVGSLRVVDPIEVYLAYETRLAQPLKLPLSTKGMLYERCSNVTKKDLNNASRAAQQADADPRQVEAYLATWEPWQGLMRRQQAEACPWQSLPTMPRGTRIDETQICVLTQETAADLQAGGNDVAAVRNGSGAWEPYDFDSLLEWWVQQGTHPVHRTPMQLKDICRVDDTITLPVPKAKVISD
jgi:hypothetical protein